MVDVDLMAYRLIREPRAFDVIAAPNLFGDVLADLGAALMGSRGVSFSGNFGEGGHAVYQTNHGAAYDLAGTDRANPAGQIFGLAMMLRESFGLCRQAAAIEQAVHSIWREGWRTEDVAIPGALIVGTRDMGCRVAERAAEILDSQERLTGVNVGDEAATHSG
jgi:3-isopropylmalate dehydrogenase